jgi:hypothetical protein
MLLRKSLSAFGLLQTNQAMQTPKRTNETDEPTELNRNLLNASTPRYPRICLGPIDHLGIALKLCLLRLALAIASPAAQAVPINQPTSLSRRVDIAAASLKTSRNKSTEYRMTFKPGLSGNPGGRPKVVGELRSLAREHTKAALEALVEIVGSKKAPPAARVAAANAILDRGYGRPETKIDATLEQSNTAADNVFAGMSSDKLQEYITLFNKAGILGRSDGHETSTQNSQRQA